MIRSGIRARETERAREEREGRGTHHRVSTSWLARQPRAVASETRYPARAFVVCSFVYTCVYMSVISLPLKPIVVVRTFIRSSGPCVVRLPSLALNDTCHRSRLSSLCQSTSLSYSTSLSSFLLACPTEKTRWLPTQEWRRVPPRRLQTPGSGRLIVTRKMARRRGLITDQVF